MASFPPVAWLEQNFALLHGEDSERRKQALEAWKLRHVDPEWADFSLTLCSEGAPWAEIYAALQEMAPFGSARVVIAPAADNLLEKAKDLPSNLKPWMEQAPQDLHLLLVCRNTLSAQSGKTLGIQPWKSWQAGGRVLKVGDLEPEEAQSYVLSQFQAMGLQASPQLALELVRRTGTNPGLLHRAVEVLELMSRNGKLDFEILDGATFRLAEQGSFSWSNAWQKGDWKEALLALRQLEEDGVDPLALLGLARKEVQRLVALMRAESEGIGSEAELLRRLGLNPKQIFLIGRLRKALHKLGPRGLRKLSALVDQVERDLKGEALNRSPTAMLALTARLCHVFSH